jgi:hypothetical protein
MNSLHAGRVGVMLAAAIVVGACGAEAAQSAPASPSPLASAAPTTATPPASTPAPTATPTPSVPSSTAPSAQPVSGIQGAQAFAGDGWLRQVLFVPDGRIVIVEDPLRGGEKPRVTMLDADGRVMDGWPWTPERDAESYAYSALGPDGSVYVTVTTPGIDETGAPTMTSHALHRLDSKGHDLPGFPLTREGVPLCRPAAGPSGDVHTVCVAGLDEGTPTSSLAFVRQDGSVHDGWPVQIEGSVQIVGFGPGGDVVLVVARESGSTMLTVLHADGTEAAGWPRPIPDYPVRTVDRLGRVHLATPSVTGGGLAAPAGTGDEGCGTVATMTYTVLGRDGVRLPGWPVTVRGWASEPLVAGDGTTTIVTAAGSMIRYGRRGSVVAGWPVRGVPVTAICGQGSSPVPAGVDEFVVAGDGQVTLVKADGVARGWPVRPTGLLADDSWLRGSGPGVPLDPAVGRKGIWVATYGDGRPVLQGIARDGSMPKAWGRVVGEEGDRIQWIRIAPSGRVWMLLDRPADEQGEGQSPTWILVPVAEDRPIAD